MDGVLIDSIALMHKLNQQRFPGSTREEFNHMFTGNFREQIDNMKDVYGTADEPEEKIASRMKAYTEEKTQTVMMYDGIFELLQELKERGILLSINTSASNANTLGILERLDIKDFFDHVVTRDITRSKVEKFKILAQRYGCEPQDFTFITDSLGDVKEAHELNIPTVAVTWGVHERNFFTEETYDHLLAVVDTVDQLRNLLIP